MPVLILILRSRSLLHSMMPEPRSATDTEARRFSLHVVFT